MCSRNRLRSPTAEQIFSRHYGMDCASAGTSNDAENPLTAELVSWAEVIIVMEKSHRTRLTTRFKRHLANKRVICLDIPDNYEYMEPALIDLLVSRMLRLFPELNAIRKG